MRQFLNQHKAEIGTALAIVVFYLLLFSFGITCPIKFLTGISCPGCGMSRAFFSAVTLHFSTAFYYHPLWVFVVPIGLLLIWFWYRQKKLPFQILLWSSVGIMIAVWLFRMLILDTPIVVFSPESSAVYRALQSIIHFLSSK